MTDLPRLFSPLSADMTKYHIQASLQRLQVYLGASSKARNSKSTMPTTGESLVTTLHNRGHLMKRNCRRKRHIAFYKKIFECKLRSLSFQWQNAWQKWWFGFIPASHLRLHYVGEDMVTGAWGSWSHCLWSQEAQINEHWQSALFPFFI